MSEGQRVTLTAETFDGPVEVTINDGVPFRAHSIEVRSVPHEPPIGVKIATVPLLTIEYEIVLRVRTKMPDGTVYRVTARPAAGVGENQEAPE